ncbi:MAG TPA: ATP-grasp domain-containing protein [Vicinamibacterales bacterium]|nr:ATP-grasp domain-containing protein [Vicinamibacterales bacterium]
MSGTDFGAGSSDLIASSARFTSRAREQPETFEIKVMPRRRVLLLSTTTGYQLRAFTDAADQLGVELLYATDRCDTLDDPWRDRAVPVRFHDERRSLDAILREARRSPLDGVIAVGDRPTVLAARVAEALDLPGNSPDAAAASANKRESRARFAAAGLPAPWYFTLPTRASIPEAAADPRVRYPCVLKPLGLSGSRGVIRADSPEEFAAAFARIRALLNRLDVRAARTGLEDVLLVEGFVGGAEVAVEGVLTGGRIQIFGMFDKPDPLDGPFFEETIYVTPTALDVSTRAAVADTVARAARSLGLWHGPVHAECRLDGVRITPLEVAARPIGGLCSRALRFDAALSLEDVLLRHALGENVAGYRQAPDASAVMMIPIPRRGHLKRVEGEAAARRVEGVVDVRITARKDQLLEPLPEAGSYLGFIFAGGRTGAQAVASLRQAHERLEIVIEREIAVRA